VASPPFSNRRERGRNDVVAQFAERVMAGEQVENDLTRRLVLARKQSRGQASGVIRRIAA
jgi:hypothetical protein